MTAQKPPPPLSPVLEPWEAELRERVPVYLVNRIACPFCGSLRPFPGYEWRAGPEGGLVIREPWSIEVSAKAVQGGNLVLVTATRTGPGSAGIAVQFAHQCHGLEPVPAEAAA